MNTQVNIPKVFSYKEQVSRSLNWGHYFLFLNIFLAALLGFIYVFSSPSTDTFVAFIYLLATWLGHMAFLSVICFVLVLFPLSFIGNFRYYRVLSVIICILLHIILLFDAKLYLSVRIHLSLTALNLIFSQFDFRTGLNYNFLFIAIPIIIALELLIAKLATRLLYKRKHKLATVIISTVFLVCFISSNLLFMWADATNYEKITNMRSVFPAHYPMTAKSFLQSHNIISKDFQFNEDNKAITYPLETITSTPHSEPINVVLININGLSYNDLGENTSNLLELKRKSNSFENYFLPYENRFDNIFATYYGIPTIYRNTLYYKNITPVVINEMQRQEFSNRFFISSITNKQESLENIIKSTGLREQQISVSNNYIAAFNSLKEHIDTWGHIRSHAATIMIDDLLKTSNKKEFDSLLRKIDAMLMQCINYIYQKDFKNTLFIISSAQGNSFLINKDIIFNRQMAHVPLLLIWPEGENIAVSNNNLASTFDLSATVASDILGINNDPNTYSLGISLKNLPPRDFVPAYSNDIFMIGPSYTIIYSSDGNSFIENRGQISKVKPNLEGLIRALTQLNRFKE